MVLTFKLISYAHVMRSVKSIHNELLEKGDCDYEVEDSLVNEDNLRIIVKNVNKIDNLVGVWDLLYFSVAPTLCY